MNLLVWYIVCGLGRLLVLVLVLGVVVVRSSVVGRHRGRESEDGSLYLIHFGYLSANDVVYDFCIQEFECMECLTRSVWSRLGLHS